MKTIFVPTDFSTCSQHACLAASQIARKTGAGIYLFHTVSTPMDWVKVPVSEESKYPETKQRILHAKQRLQGLAESDCFEGVQVRWELHYNEHITESLRAAECLQSDLIVMGTHGTSTLTRMMLGSNTQQVVRLSGCPVLTINEHARTFDIKRIVVASDFQEEAGMAPTLQLVMDLENAFGAEVELLKVEGLFPQKDFDAGVWENLVAHEFAKKATISIDPFATVDEGIIQYAVDKEADLIVVISHARKGLARFLMGSVAETVVNFSPIPVLVTHHAPLTPATAEAAIGKLAAGMAISR